MVAETAVPRRALLELVRIPPLCQRSAALVAAEQKQGTRMDGGAAERLLSNVSWRRLGAGNEGSSFRGHILGGPGAPGWRALSQSLFGERPGAEPARSHWCCRARRVVRPARWLHEFIGA